MKSIKTKLALFVSCLCIVLIGLVWLLTVVLFEPNYRSMIRTELNTKIAAVAAVLEGDQAEDADILSLISLVKPLMQSGICIEVSATEECIEAHGYTSPTLGTAVPAYRAFFVLEGIGDGCQLHPSSQGVLGDKTELDSTLAVAKRKETAIKGRLSETLVDLSSSPYRQQQVVGMVTSSGYIILASTNLERVDQAMQVVSHQLILISVILLAVSLISALLFARWFTRPVSQLSSAAKQVAAGNYDVAVQIRSQDELGTLARDFNYMTREISKSTQLQRDLIANISHDLRTPLTLIRGYAETIRDLDGEDKDRRDDDLSVIIDESDRLSVLVNSVMELSKYSSGAEKPNPSRFDLAELVADVLRRYSDRAEKEGLTLLQEGPEEIEVIADPVQIGRVLHNLVSNAVAHLESGGQVTVRLIDKKESVRAEVIDNGSGIDEKELPFIFDRYYRSRSDAGKRGSGLGLSIVKAILVAHNAPFGVQSVVGQGSDFWFELPPAPPAEPQKNGKPSNKT